MAGTFASFNTALSAIRYQQTAMGVASNNVANATTEGYVRRRAEAVSVGGPTAPAMWSRPDGVAGGVGLAGIQRIVDPFLDMRSRREHATQSFLDTRLDVLSRVETGVGEPGKNGVAAALDAYSAAWEDLGNNPDGDAARSQVLATGSAVANALRTQAANVESELGDQRNHVLNLATEVTTIAGDLGSINKALAGASLEGTDTNDLLDQRDRLAQQLASLTGGQATERPDGGMNVTVGGVSLVNGATVSAVSVLGGIAADGSSDGTPLSLGIGGTAVATSVWSGELGGVAELITTTLPDYLTGLNQVATTLADTINAQHRAGYDLAGTAGTAFFTIDPARGAAASLQVALTDTSQVAASGVPGQVVDGSNAQKLGAINPASGGYQRLVNNLGSTVQSAERMAATQRLLTTQVESSREQLTGISLDEETVNMLQAQRSYEAASKVMSVLDSVLDTLINRTGVTR